MYLSDLQLILYKYGLFIIDFNCLILFVQARTYLDPAEIFKSEAEEAYEKTRKAVQICSFFQETFEDVRRNIPKFFKEGEQVKQWEFANELVFTRMDQFILRLKTVEVGRLNMFLYLEVANGKFETLRDSKPSIFLCKPESF